MAWNGEKKNMYRLGIDIGTATVKLALTDENKTRGRHCTTISHQLF